MIIDFDRINRFNRVQVGTKRLQTNLADTKPTESQML
jgi:hypothetical protein